MTCSAMWPILREAVSLGPLSLTTFIVKATVLKQQLSKFYP